MQRFDWIVLIIFTLISMVVGLLYTRSAATKGQEGFFTANRNLSWWSLGISNSATYQSGLGAFVMLIFLFGFSGNWLWWAQWIIWMPLVAIIWSRMWQRMRIVTTAELISLRYGGKTSVFARRAYALIMCLFSIITMAYITGFFAKTITPLVPMSMVSILLLFGTVTLIYTLTGGLMGSVMVSVVQMIIMIAGSLVFLAIIIPQQGGWASILSHVESTRQSALSLNPVSDITPPLTLLMFVILGLFFAGSPTAGEGMTAQRFMAAKNEKHALGGQLFSTFISLCLRIIPLVGLGIICITMFWSGDLVSKYGQAPAGFKMLSDPAYAWGELIKASHLPSGFTGLLVATEVAAYMSTLSALINWGSSFIVNDFYKELKPDISKKQEVNISRLTTLILFIIASLVAILFVDDMVSWFIFINSVVVIFWLPLAYFRFFWPRFNVWGEMAATILGIPLTVLFWFILDFQHKPIWQGTGMLFIIALLVISLVTIITPPESDETLKNFYMRCRPPAGWKKLRMKYTSLPGHDQTLKSQIFDCLLGIVACFGLTMATNAVFVGNWLIITLGNCSALGFGAWLIKRSFTNKAVDQVKLL
jgi:solute:Na+ symporter, SSS family